MGEMRQINEAMPIVFNEEVLRKQLSHPVQQNQAKEHGKQEVKQNAEEGSVKERRREVRQINEAMPIVFNEEVLRKQLSHPVQQNHAKEHGKQEVKQNAEECRLKERRREVHQINESRRIQERQRQE